MNDDERHRIEVVCLEHAALRGWVFHTVNARSNHVQLVVTADKKPSVVRDQFKAYATRAVREGRTDSVQGKIWTREGDIQIIDDEEELERVIHYVAESQDRRREEK